MEERVRFRNADGLILAGAYSPAPAPTGRAVLLCHGLSADKDEGGQFPDLARRLNACGFAVFRFDFRGHGESEGESVSMTITGEARDLEAAVTHCKTRGHGRFGLLAASFAGGAASLYAARNPDDLASLILWNAVVDYSDWRGNRLPGGEPRWNAAALHRLETEGVLEAVSDPPFLVGRGLVAEVQLLEPWKELVPLSIPMLAIHGDQDRVVSHDLQTGHAKEMKAAEVLTIRGADHGFRSAPEHAEAAITAAVEFFQQTL